MARVFLVPPTPRPDLEFDHLLADFDLVRASAASTTAEHAIAGEPAGADILLYLGSRDPMHREIRSHPLHKAFPFKTVVYDSADRIIPFLPGIYASIERRYYDPRRTRSGFYLRWSNSEYVRFTDPASEPALLYSFVGAATTHPLRRKVLALPANRALLRDSSKDAGRGFGQPAEVYRDYRRRYGEELARARFVLCPRGAGAGSMRIFEAMKAGRVPVVVSDRWVPPDGPDWNSFSIRVRERNISEIPAILQRLESEAARMGHLARQAWLRHFSPDAAFDTLVRWSSELLLGMKAHRKYERVARILAPLQLARLHFLRHVILARALSAIKGSP